MSGEASLLCWLASRQVDPVKEPMSSTQPAKTIDILENMRYIYIYNFDIDVMGKTVC